MSRNKRFDTEPMMEVSGEVAVFIKANDFDWWLEAVQAKDVKASLKDRFGIKTRAAENHLFYLCQHYGKTKLKSKSTSKLLSPDQWEKLKIAITPLLPLMEGRTINLAVRIARTKISCDWFHLRGLPTRFHVWKG